MSVDEGLGDPMASAVFVRSQAAGRREEPPLRVALFIEATLNLGGALRQPLSAVEALVHNGASKHEFVVFTPREDTRRLLSSHGIDAIRYRRGVYRLLDRWSSTVLGGALLRRIRRLGLRRLGRHLDALLDDHRVDLVLLNEQAEAALRIGDHPFIITLWDLDHRDHPEFPEWFANRAFERTERSLAVTLTRAVAVIASLPSVARRIAYLYRVDPHRIIELPLLPSIAVRRHAGGHGTATAEGVRQKYALPARFVFYPAFFSFYKNHLYLLESLVELERRHGIVLEAVFCGGGDPEDQAYVERQVEALGLTQRVHFLGYVPEDEVPALYEGALALVMPSYFGPTNLPPLEAVTLGCPVIYSDLPDFRELIGDAALYCDLEDPASLAGHLAYLIQDPASRGRLLEAGRKRAAEIAQTDYGARLEKVFDEYAYLRRRWAWPGKAG